MKKLTKILGIVLTVALALSLFAGAVSVSAAGPGENEWDEVGLPETESGSEVGVMAVDPADGTIWAAIYDGSDWNIMTSSDEGFNWDDTSLTDIGVVADIVISSDGETVYVGTVAGDVYRIEDDGDSNLLLMPIADFEGDPVGTLYEMDIFYDGSYNWIMVATDLDVLVLKDDPMFPEWRDQQLATGAGLADAVYCAFSPDFATSFRFWAIWDNSGDFELTSTVAPGQWGLTIAPTDFVNENGDTVDWSPFTDIAFADDYDTVDNPVMYVALVGNSYWGNLFLVQAGASTTDAEFMFPTDRDLGSVEVSGSVILTIEFGDSTLWRSINAGDTFAEAEKGPMGFWWPHVYMAPGPFDPDTGHAYAGALGPGTAFCLSTDGGNTWNGVSYMDVDIASIDDLTFQNPTYMITTSTAGYTSLWRSDDGDSWQWVYSEFFHGDADFDMLAIESALEDDTLMMFVDTDSDYEVWKSDNQGHTWLHWRDLPSTMTSINDWVVVNGTTIYAATDAGFWGTSSFGPANVKLTTGNWNSIAVDGDNVAVGNMTDGTVAVSADGGETWGTPVAIANGAVCVAYGPDGTLYAAASGDGATAEEVLQVSVTGNAVSASKTEALEDSTEATAAATGFSGIWVSPDNTIYAMGGTVVAPTTPTTDLFLQGTLDLYEWEWMAPDPLVTLDFGDGMDFPLTDPDWADTDTVYVDGIDLQATGFDSVAGTIFVNNGTDAADTIIINMSVVLDDITEPLSPGEDDFYYDADTLAVVEEETDAGDAGSSDNIFWRLLADVSNNVWENSPNDSDIDGALGLWGTSGSNVLWTIVSDTLWALEDTLTVAPTLLTPALGSTVPGYYNASLTWALPDGAEGVVVFWVPGDGTADIDSGLESADLEGLEDNTEYTWCVQVPAGAPFQSPKSAYFTFTTTDYLDAPGLVVPLQGSQDYSLYPSFVWSAIPGADTYTLELSANADFSDAVVVTTALTQYTHATALEYDTNYFWRVRALSEVGGVSLWSLTGDFHTGTEAMPPVVIEPTPTQNITLTVPEAETPGYIWAIIAIGALLTLAVIVLIVRTRRVV